MNLSIEPNPAIQFRIRHQDECVLVLEKPARIPTQPGKGHLHDTILNGLFATHGPALQQLGKSRDFGLLHRLDKDTSGLLIVALRADAYDGIRAQFEAREISKWYWAVCSKAPRAEAGMIRLSIAETRGGNREPKLAKISRTGPPAQTAYRVLSRSDLGAVLEARPITGRLHQVRVHLEAIGAPILGDDFYAPKGVADAAPRLALHSHRIQFRHPITEQLLDVRSPWPRDLRGVLNRLGLPRPDLDSVQTGDGL